MSICKVALSIATRHPIYLGVYVVFLSLMGVFLAIGSVPAEEGETTYAAERARIAVIDRDASDLSRALAAYLGENHDAIDVDDEARAMQDALATGSVDVIIVVPEGFGARCLDAARSGGEPPAIEAAYGGYAQAAVLAEQQALRWVALASAAASLMGDAGASEVAAAASDAAYERASTEVLAGVSSTGPALPLQAYLNFASYSIVCSVIVCAGLVFSQLGAPGIRLRNLASAVPAWRMDLEVLAGCLVFTVAVWAVTGAVGVVASGAVPAGVEPVRIACALGVMLVFSLVPLALAFLLAQLGLREEGLNALGNIGGMLMSFLGGAWVPISMLGEAVQTAARFTPTYWTNDAVWAVLFAPSLTGSVLARIGAGVGITALFALAFAAIGLAVGRARLSRAQV